jgi:hypothetical protein
MIEVLKQMVAALKACNRSDMKEVNEAIQAGKQAIAELESQEPVAWMDEYNACKCPDNEARCFSDRVFRMMQKYATPPAAQRTWVGLTDEEMLECNMDGDLMIDRETAKRNVEAKLKEKNSA